MDLKNGNVISKLVYSSWKFNQNDMVLWRKLSLSVEQGVNVIINRCMCSILVTIMYKNILMNFGLFYETKMKERVFFLSLSQCHIVTFYSHYSDLVLPIRLKMIWKIYDYHVINSYQSNHIDRPLLWTTDNICCFKIVRGTRDANWKELWIDQ